MPNTKDLTPYTGGSKRPAAEALGYTDATAHISVPNLSNANEIGESIVAAAKKQLNEAGIDESNPNYHEYFSGLVEGIQDELEKSGKSGSKPELTIIKSITKHLETEVKKSIPAASSTTPVASTTQPLEIKNPTVTTGTTAQSPSISPDEKHEAREKEKTNDKEITVKEKINKDETENLKTRKTLIDLEIQQRKLFTDNLKDMDIKSKVMAERGNKALEQLDNLYKTEGENINSISDASRKVLEEIRDLMKAARHAGLEKNPEIQRKVESLKAYGQKMADLEGDTEGKRIIGTAADNSINALGKPNISLVDKLTSHYKNKLKTSVKNLYEETVPEGVRIVAEDLGGRFGGNKRKMNAARVESEYNAEQDYIDKRQNEEDRDRHKKSGSRRNSNFDGITNSPDSTVFGAGRKRSIGPRYVKNDNISNSSSTNKVSVKTLTVENLIINSKRLTNTKEGDDATEKDDRIEKTENDKLDVEYADRNTSKGGLAKKLGGEAEGGGIMEIAAKALAVAAAGVAAYEITKHIVNPALNRITQFITGDKDATVGTGLYNSIDKLRGLFGGGEKGADEKASHQVAVDIFHKHMLAQNNKLTPDQMKWLKGEGIDVSTATVDVNADKNVKPILPLTKDDYTGRTASGKIVVAPTSLAGTPPDGVPNIETSTSTNTTNTTTSSTDKISPPANVSPPSADIASKTNLVDAVSRNNETMRDVRGAKPNIIVNNVNNGSKGDSGAGALPIGMGSSRNQEPAFRRYLLAISPGM